MEASEFVRYRANVTSLAKGSWTVDATVEVQRSSHTVVTSPLVAQRRVAQGMDTAITPIIIEVEPDTLEAEILARLRSFVDKLRAEYPAQAAEK